jgi:hypothetical protein
MGFGFCPNCENKVDIMAEPELGLHVMCKACQMELVIIWLNPIELSLIDYEDYEIYDDEPYIENFQKIKKKQKGGYDANKQNH